MPCSCIFHVAGGETCQLGVDHWRDRKTGPCFPLAVADCAVHGHAFTLYPPGHVPYGRKAVAPTGLDGEPLAGEVGASRDWRGTLFEAAVDAAAGEPWDRSRPGGSDWWWSTQGRLLSHCLDLVGAGSEQELELRHRIAQILAADTLVLLEGVQAIVRDPGYRSRGRAVMAVLAALTARCALRRVLAAGHQAGLWGPPLLWRRGALHPLAFRCSGTDPP